MKNSNSEMIGFYEGPYYMFSNFSSFAVNWKGKLWMTSEHAYQAAKFLDPILQEKIWNTRSAYDSKILARSFDDKKREDWQEINLEIMEEIVRAKLEQHPYIQKKLIESGSKLLVETSPNDDFWGWGPNKDGQNHLGKIWMKLRDEMSK
jgi:N-glycosidase YbiA